MKSIGPIICAALLAIVIPTRAESLSEAALKFPGLRVSTAVKPPDTFEAAYANTLRMHFSPSPENATSAATSS